MPSSDVSGFAEPLRRNDIDFRPDAYDIDDYGTRNECDVCCAAEGLPLRFFPMSWAEVDDFRRFRSACGSAPYVNHGALGRVVRTQRFFLSMKRSSSRWTVAWVLASSLACSAAMAESTTCTPDEQVVFRCRAGQKIIAVCGSTQRADTLAYRFGSPTKAELTLSSNGVGEEKATVSGGSMAYSGGGGAYLRFKRAGVDYVVYTAISSQWGEQSGVVPERDGKALRGTRCVGRVQSQIGPELFKRAGLPVEESGFALPR